MLLYHILMFGLKFVLLRLRKRHLLVAARFFSRMRRDLESSTDKLASLLELARYLTLGTLFTPTFVPDAVVEVSFRGRPRFLGNRLGVNCFGSAAIGLRTARAPTSSG